MQIFSEKVRRAHCIKEIWFRFDQPITVSQGFPFFCYELSTFLRGFNFVRQSSMDILVSKTLVLNLKVNKLP